VGGRKYSLIIIIFFLGVKVALASTLITIESQKAYLTLSLLKRFVRLEENLKNKKKIKILVLVPEIKSAFQDQNIVNDTVRSFFEKNKDIFEPVYVNNKKEVQKMINNKKFDIFYIAGLIEGISELITLATNKKIFTVSHLPELVSEGVALSLDLERRNACIIANYNTWQKIGIKIPAKILNKITFIDYSNAKYNS